MDKKESNLILIIDFGSQYTQLIARRVRESGVYSLVKSNQITEKEFKNLSPIGIILSGGPNSVNSKTKYKLSNFIFNSGVPILGICYGMQLIADFFGGKVMPSAKKEFGNATFRITSKTTLFKNIKNKNEFNVWMSHSDKVITNPSGFKTIGCSKNTKNAAIYNAKKNIYCLQFHPEVTHTKNGKIIISNFLYEVCGCKKNWTTTNIIKDISSTLKDEVGDKKVILALSGGVDSTVVAALLNKALPKQLTCVFIDTGLMRKNEVQEVEDNISNKLGIKLVTVNAKSIFFKKLKGVTSPEKKRKIIGETFIRLFEAHARKIKNIAFLAQGTIYPDIIESSSKDSKSDVIKSHHNVGGLPKKMKFKLVEPIKLLFKDEVRRIGKALKIPIKLIERHPFPGPGLAVRIIGEITQDKVGILQEVDNIFIEELHKNNLYRNISQALAVFLPIKSVGVMGDQRQYSYVVALRAVKTIDFMTATVSEIPYKILNIISTRIVNEVQGVSRVVYDITSKPPGTIEWE
jgi:GMP synthase (glutamine-hydrolysing)